MIEINPAKIEHAEMIAHLNQRVQTLHIKNTCHFFNQPQKEEIKKWFTEILAKPNTIAFLATNDKQAIGYILAIIHEKQNDIFTKERRWLYLDQISVDSEWERKGIGRKLFDKLLEKAQSENITEIETDTWAFNDTAQKFFNQIGFKPKIIRHLMELKNKNLTTKGCT